MTLEETYETTTMFHPSLATELTVVPLQVIKDQIGVSTPNSVYLSGLEESVQYLVVEKQNFLPLSTAISLVQRSKMDSQRKRDVVLELMQLLYTPTTAKVGALVSALENMQGELYTKLHTALATAINSYGNGVETLYTTAFNKLNYADVPVQVNEVAVEEGVA